MNNDSAQQWLTVIVITLLCIMVAYCYRSDEPLDPVCGPYVCADPTER